MARDFRSSAAWLWSALALISGCFLPSALVVWKGRDLPLWIIPIAAGIPTGMASGTGGVQGRGARWSAASSVQPESPLFGLFPALMKSYATPQPCRNAPPVLSLERLPAPACGVGNQPHNHHRNRRGRRDRGHDRRHVCLLRGHRREVSPHGILRFSDLVPVILFAATAWGDAFA